MKHKILILAICASFFFATSCKKDEDPAPVDKVTYVADVKPIFLNSCTPCHLAGGVNPNKWDDYTQAKNKISVILDRVQRTPGTTGFMPKVGSALTSAQIATLKQWVTDGLLEN
jgi:mono/diheme cytochrome c family protein